jgi:hypothetical protein
MDISGAMGLFSKLDVDPLQLGDYLGWIFYSLTLYIFKTMKQLFGLWIPLSVIFL